jgi:hypothetical protein
MNPDPAVVQILLPGKRVRGGKEAYEDPAMSTSYDDTEILASILIEQS